MNDKISVIIPVYNVEQYLKRCLDSVIHNTYSNLEILCVDDESPDSSGQIIDEYAKKDSRIIPLHIEHGGLSHARNAGLRQASGKYVIFIDSDDWVHERLFEVLYTTITKYDVDLSYCDYVRTSDPSAMDYDFDAYSSKEIDIYEMMETHQMKSYVWRRLFKKEVIDSLFFCDIKIEDLAFIIDLIVSHPDLTAVYTDLKLYAYYINEQSLSTKLDHNTSAELCFFESSFLEKTEGMVRECVAIEIIKRGMSTRLSYRVLKQKEQVRMLDIQIKKALVYIKKRRSLYTIFYKFPGLYLLWRIIGDKTMLQYIRELKQRNDI